MSRPRSTTEILEAILRPRPDSHANDLEGLEIVIESEPEWFGALTITQPNREGPEGQAQATISIDERRFAICLEPLL